MNMFGHEYFMRIALTQAQIAFDNDEVPVGAIIVHQNKIIAKGHNLCEKLIKACDNNDINNLQRLLKKKPLSYLNK